VTGPSGITPSIKSNRDSDANDKSDVKQPSSDESAQVVRTASDRSDSNEEETILEDNSQGVPADKPQIRENELKAPADTTKIGPWILKQKNYSTGVPDLIDPLLISDVNSSNTPDGPVETEGSEIPEPEPTEPRQGYPPLTGREALWLRIRAVCFSMVCAGIGAWTNQLAKAGVQLIDTSVHEDNQLDNWTSWAIILSVVPCAGLQLKAMGNMMDEFEAVLIIPIYQCVFIFNLILQGAFYFEELDNLNEENLAWFIGSLCFILIGIGYLSRSHPSRA